MSNDTILHTLLKDLKVNIVVEKIQNENIIIHKVPKNKDRDSCLSEFKAYKENHEIINRDGPPAYGLTPDQLKALSKSFIDKLFESRVILPGTSEFSKKFQNSDYLSKKIVEASQKMKASFTCPLDLNTDGLKWDSAISTPLNCYANFASLERMPKKLLLVNSFEIFIEAKNKISIGQEADIKFNVTYDGSQYYLWIKATGNNNVKPLSYSTTTGNNNVKPLTYSTVTNDFDSLLKTVDFHMTDLLFNLFYRDVIKSVTGETVTSDKFSFDVYATLFDMIEI